MSHPEIDRIRADMARCRERIAELRAGARGVRTGAWDTLKTGEHGAAVAQERQLLAQSTALQQFELEYVQAMLPVWGPAAIIERMEAPPLVPQIVERPPSGEDIKAAVFELLLRVPNDATVASLKELIS